MTIILLQIAALAVFAWLLRGSGKEPEAEQVREQAEPTPRKR